MPRKNYILVLSLFVLLTGCTRYEWIKPIGDPSTYGTDVYACKKAAMKLAPPAFQVVESSVSPYKSKKTIETSCSKRDSIKNCLKTVKNSEYHPPERVIDLNKSNRNDLHEACMQSKGWVLTAVEEE